MKPPKDNALIIFMKAPQLGEVKTRLQPDLSPEVSLNLYKAMGKDLVDQFVGSDHFDLFVRYLPEDAIGEMKSWLGMNLNYFPQRGSDLGEKLKNSFSSAFQQDYQEVCIIGSDLPTLTENDILEAYERLVSADVVLGPALDGGYYLVALKNFHPEIFENIDWSTENVFKQTIDQIAQQNLSVSRMAVRRDIDTYTDVRHLRNKILRNENKFNKEIPNTFAALWDIFGETK